MARWLILTTPWVFNRGEANERTLGTGRRVRVDDDTATLLTQKGAARDPLDTDHDRVPAVDLTE